MNSQRTKRLRDVLNHMVSAEGLRSEGRGLRRHRLAVTQFPQLQAADFQLLGRGQHGDPRETPATKQGRAITWIVAVTQTPGLSQHSGSRGCHRQGPAEALMGAQAWSQGYNG